VQAMSLLVVGVSRQASPPVQFRAFIDSCLKVVTIEMYRP
jgi:hypothetical protein